MDPQTSRACFLKPQPASATLREPGRTLQQVKPTCAWIRMQHPEHHQAKDVVCLSVPGSTYSILQGSTQRCVSEHTVPAGLLGAKAIKALMAVRLDKRGLPNRKCGGATFDVPAAMTLRNAAGTDANTTRTRVRVMLPRAAVHIASNPGNSRTPGRHTGRVRSLPFPSEKHSSTISELSLRNVTCSSSSLSTLRSHDLPQKRPLSLVSILRGLLRPYQTCPPAGFPRCVHACAKFVPTLLLRKLHKPLPRKLKVSLLAQETCTPVERFARGQFEMAFCTSFPRSMLHWQTLRDKGQRSTEEISYERPR